MLTSLTPRSVEESAPQRWQQQAMELFNRTWPVTLPFMLGVTILFGVVASLAPPASWRYSIVSE